LTALEGLCAPEEPVILHMSIAPLVSQEELDDVIDVCIAHGSAFSAVPSYMCMCSTDGETDGIPYSDTFLDREQIFGLNTPQAVRYGTLVKLYREAHESGYDFDERPHLSTLMFDMHQSVYYSKSSPVNIKITTQQDFDLCEAYLQIHSSHSTPSTKEA
jgi:2-C-methyl-D-erythritol 4-phosphate cytidylyltransferase